MSDREAQRRPGASERVAIPPGVMSDRATVLELTRKIAGCDPSRGDERRRLGASEQGPPRVAIPPGVMSDDKVYYGLVEWDGLRSLQG